MEQANGDSKEVREHLRRLEWAAVALVCERTAALGDKSGQAYIAHLARVAVRFKHPELRIVAWMHDLVEDTETTIGEIRQRFGGTVSTAVGLLTHLDGMSYDDYVARLSVSRLATFVKLSDLTDNQALWRREGLDPAFIASKTAKYVKADAYLRECCKRKGWDYEGELV